VAGGTVVLSLVLVQTPGLAALLHMHPLHLDDWATAAVGSVVATAAPWLAGALGAAQRASGRNVSTGTRA
jgi:hypothetical protein